MDTANGERAALIERMLEARTWQEIEAAEKHTGGWLKKNLRDPRILAARERLAERVSRARDPERKVNRLTLTVSVTVFLPVTLIGGALSGWWFTASIAGLLAAPAVSSSAWELFSQTLAPMTISVAKPNEEAERGNEICYFS